MVGESLAIIVVIFGMAFMFARSGKRIFASFTLPLVSIPLLHLIGVMLRFTAWLLIFDLAGLVIGATLCIIFSRAFRAKRNRIGYLFFCLAFMVALMIAFVLRLY